MTIEVYIYLFCLKLGNLATKATSLNYVHIFCKSKFIALFSGLCRNEIRRLVRSRKLRRKSLDFLVCTRRISVKIRERTRPPYSPLSGLVLSRNHRRSVILTKVT